MHASLLTLAGILPGIGGLDAGIVIAFLVVSTLFAVVMKGRQAGVRDFFLADRNLPWVVVCLSLIATEISAAGFVGVPYGAFSGSLVYLQLAIGAILARFIIGYYFIPAFYNGEFYSPYQYVGQRLGLGAERMTKILFMIGAILGQAVRVFIVAVVLEVITGVPVVWAILLITTCAVLWTVIGGIRTVVWTDVIQIFVIVAAAVATGIYLIAQTSGGISEIFRTASEAGKLSVLDFRFDHMLALTIWTGLFGSTFNTLASHGADQMNTQRLFCCRSSGEARKAILWSGLSQVLVLLLLCLGLGLFCYWGQHADEFLKRTYGVGEMHAFPVFIASVMPAGLKGLLIIGLLAAAISSLNSALVALSQTTTPCPRGDSPPPAAVDDRAEVRRARWRTLAWGVVLALVALYCHSVILIDIVVGSALKMTTFTYGALLGALLLAFLPHQRDGRGLLLAAPIAALAAFGMSLHEPWTDLIVVVGVVLVFAGWCYSLFHEVEQLNDIKDQNKYIRHAWYVLLAEFPRTIWVVAGAALVLYLHFGELYTSAAGGAQRITWPWYLPMGVGITMILGYLLSRPKIAKD